jgi:hypothetical protein
MIQSSPFDELELLKYASEGPHIDYFLKNADILNEDESADYWRCFMDNVARIGDLDTLRLLHETRTEGCSSNAMDDACLNGHLDVVKFLHDNRSDGCSTMAMDNAAQKGHLEVVKFLHHNRTEGCTTSALNYAAQSGHLDMVQFLHEHRSEGCTKSAIDYAAENGFLNVVRFLRENRTEGWTDRALAASIAHGCTTIFKYLHGPQRQCSEKCTTKIIDDLPHDITPLETYKFLLDYCEGGYSSTALEKAAEVGNYDIWRFLHGPTCSERCTSKAFDDNFRTMQSLEDLQVMMKTCTSKKWSGDAYLTAARLEDLEKVKFLHGSVCSDSCYVEGLEYALGFSNFSSATERYKLLATYFLDHCPRTWTKRALMVACDRGYLEFVKHLHGLTCTERCSSENIEAAMQSQHLDVVKYLFNNCEKRLTNRMIRYADKYEKFETYEYLKSVGALETNEEESDSSNLWCDDSSFYNSSPEWDL